MLSKQGEQELGGDIRLSKHGSSRLLQDQELARFDLLFSHVGVHDPVIGRFGVGILHGKSFFLEGQPSSKGTHLADGFFDNIESRLDLLHGAHCIGRGANGQNRIRQA